MNFKINKKSSFIILGAYFAIFMPFFIWFAIWSYYLSSLKNLLFSEDETLVKFVKFFAFEGDNLESARKVALVFHLFLCLHY